ncbi:SprT-like domain-containing protein [Candidatus Woesearchaeota archaeon]|nr:SprT-like domain-containing protein [Candidatus Woesearchaeota archaeon]MBW3021440.1 SprT-like domain-containing protein [Candidatus Woesearchaeota archaeon]
MKEELVRLAFERLYPEKDLGRTISLKYSGRFSDYNANVRMTSKEIVFSLSKKWRGVNKEIVIGLIQDLLVKLYKKKKKTLNIDLYHNFIKSLHYAIPKEKTDPILEGSFDRVNEKYFHNLIEKPNLVLSQQSKRKLGSYDFHTDTISITRSLLEKERELLDYVMYHEMLHKKLKFKSNSTRNQFHSTEFKKAEKAFENSAEIEKRLKYVGIRRKKSKTRLFNIFK